MTSAIGKRHRGFTLIELLLVLTLLAVVLAFTMPSLTGYARRLEQKQSLDIVRNSLLQARRQAIESGQVVRWNPNHVSLVQPELQIQVSPLGHVEFRPGGICSEARIQLVDDQNRVFAALGCSGATGSIVSLPQP